MKTDKDGHDISCKCCEFSRGNACYRFPPTPAFGKYVFGVESIRPNIKDALACGEFKRKGKDEAK